MVALLTLLWGLLLRRLVIRIWLPGTLGVAGRGAVIRHLSAVGGLIPALLRLLCALLAWNLLSARRSRIVDGDSRVLVQGWLIYAPLVVGHLWRQAGGLELGAVHPAGTAGTAGRSGGVCCACGDRGEAATRGRVVADHFDSTNDHSRQCRHCQSAAQTRRHQPAMLGDQDMSPLRTNPHRRPWLAAIGLSHTRTVIVQRSVVCWNG
ncbi:Uncharacterised protein [Mycobacteroides abscessus subsp. abscessus]|nr:Uncharacterised protein [Mycobacteroides abscessus subsp. abscessus]